VLKPESWCQAVEARKTWQKFGATSGKTSGVVEESKEDVVIEDPDASDRNAESQLVQQLRQGVKRIQSRTSSSTLAMPRKEAW
jgi:hypothetical protein